MLRAVRLWGEVMKNVMLCGAAILLMTPGAAFAEQGAVEGAEKGAVLHIEALGEVPPDMARLSATVSVERTSQAAADAALAAKKAEITGKLTTLGIGAADVVWSGPPLSNYENLLLSVSTVEADAPMAAGARVKQAARTPNLRSAADISVSLRDLAKLPQVTAVLSGEGVNFFGANQTTFLTSDPAGAHSRAVALALVHAQAEAESYAAAMHRHVGAVLRVANTKPVINLPDVAALMSHMEPGNPLAKMAMSTTTAAVQVDYQLLP